MGLELYWVDALTGGDLNRWFPLAAPSDYLYFLPQRAGVDSRKKLRLISSATGPIAPQLARSDSTPAKWKYWPTPAAFGRRQSLTRLFFGNLSFPSPAGDPDRASSVEGSLRTDEVQGVLRTVDCDHFCALPVSDGYHLIFTDPGSGLVCLGSDAPLGGPTRLVRKIMFIPPERERGQRKSSPLRYAVGKALDWGLRLVVVYDDDRVVLYTVPADIFNQIRDQKGTTDAWDENSGVLGQSDLIMDSLMASHEDDTVGDASTDEETDTYGGVANQPLQLEGCIISTVDGRVVDDLAVQSENGGLAVWIFYRSGMAELYNIYAPRGYQVQRRYVGDNGLVYDDAGAEQKHDEPSSQTSKHKEKEEDDRHVKWAGQGIS
ncbi:hypothetical protein A1O7_01440 [Cladophialophora yegresii CBS 114405]|uniref:Uncharacterized protein n=1 Tax=Cladophialophora yegresii CBS 114405 TaxID=1182544 RepID=W9WJE9_9EURO|nr:uncharacterized protein A1O7_01440 [Cladophialophora yegresii CBS 114405]EXJ65100.1 hypothetical protein A1O7_01440 [Cladophialophora yegresii CBS 114405]